MKTQINGIEIEIQRGFYVIESNRGNHSGMNRTWKQWNVSYANRSDARDDMAETANDANGLKPRDIGYCTKTDDSAWVDGKIYMVVNANELLATLEGTGTNLANIHAITVLQ